MYVLNSGFECGLCNKLEMGFGAVEQKMNWYLLSYQKCYKC